MKRNYIMVMLLTVVMAGWPGPARAQESISPAPSVTAAQQQTNSTNAENHKAYVLGTNGTLYVTLPSGWKDSAKRVRGIGGLHDAIIFTPGDTNQFNLMIVIFSVAEKHAGAGELKNSLLQSGERELTNCVETSLTIRDLEGGGAAGAYFRVTDRRLTAVKPAAGDFKFMTRGFAVLEPLVLTFELDSNDADRDEPAALKVLREARFTP
jgi:hypothetical protein